MNLEAIASFLATNGCGLVGKTLFVTEIPSGCDTGILLMDAYRGTPVNSELPGYFVTEFRLIVRSVDYAAGKVLAKKAVVALTPVTGFVAETMQVQQCLALNLPRPYRRSVGGYWEFEVDLEIVFVDLSA